MRTLLYSLLGIVFLLSCNKTDKLQNTPAKPNQLITDAKYYVDSIRQEVFPNGRSATGSDSILWEQAIIRHFSQIDAVSVPLFSDSSQKATFDNHILPLKLESYLLVYKGSDSNFHHLVMKLLRTSSNNPAFSGAVMLEDLSGNKLTAYTMEDGAIVKMPTPRNSGIDNARAVYSCVTINYWYSVNGGPWQFNFSNTYCTWYDVADNGGSNLPVGNQELPPPEDGGGGGDMSGNTPGNNNSGTPTSIQDVRSGVRSPCLSSVLSTVVFSDLNSNITNSFRVLYENNDRLTCDFQEDTLADRLDAIGRYQPQGINSNEYTVTITLNTKRNNSSQEYIAATIYHEIVHALLFAKYKNPDEVRDHIEMSFGSYFETQVNSLRSLFPNLSYSDAKKLVWIGLEDTQEYLNLSVDEKNDIQIFAGKHKNGTAGTNCN
ncbi:hypothetical protein ACE38W_13595 [Chitinophaga sp. Hz27]|uniref:hypothetical protein n=1 Tax=Chitinophaga sp. Hz27 TaxID=3347169 RepID=UPI0035D67E81